MSSRFCWSRSLEKARRTYEILVAEPGLTRAQLGRRLGLSYVDSRLCTLEAAGFLLMEDDAKRLWPFRDVSQESKGD